MSAEHQQPPRSTVWRRRLGTAEGWLALAAALGAWVYAMRPVGPMVGLPAEQFVRDISPLLPAVLGLGLAAGGIRHGNKSARLAGWWSVALVVPLIVLVLATSPGVRRLVQA